MREITLAAGDLAASFVPRLSLVGSSLKHRGEELLGTRGGLDAWAQRGQTMGIPLLHPWANRLSGWSYEVDGHHVELARGSAHVRPDEHGLPMHGLLHGDTNWKMTEHTVTELRAEFDFGADSRRMRLFPFAHVLAVHAILDPVGLQITTTLTATGDVPSPSPSATTRTFGLPTYPAPPGRSSPTCPSS